MRTLNRHSGAFAGVVTASVGRTLVREVSAYHHKILVVCLVVRLLRGSLSTMIDGEFSCLKPTISSFFMFGAQDRGDDISIPWSCCYRFVGLVNNGYFSALSGGL